jgi:hypothetical protein
VDSLNEVHMYVVGGLYVSAISLSSGNLVPGTFPLYYHLLGRTWSRLLKLNDGWPGRSQVIHRDSRGASYRV